LEEILAHVLTQYRLESKNLTSWLLYRTSILAYVRCLIETKRVGIELFQNQLLFHQNIAAYRKAQENRRFYSTLKVEGRENGNKSELRPTNI
jgi:hypothetical protein